MTDSVRYATAVATACLGLALSIPCPAQGGVSPVPSYSRADAAHMLRRATFGAAAEDIDVIEGPILHLVGTAGDQWERWVEEQLHPDTIPENPKVAELLGQMALPQTPWVAGQTLADADQLQYARLAYAMESHRQLQARMTEFWEIHFNTSLHVQRPYISANVPASPPALTPDEIEDLAAHLEWQQHQMFRSLALSDFRTLIEALVKDPAMMIYLNTVQISGCNGNENFARELLELHTLGELYRGPDIGTFATGSPNYDQADIDNVAKILSGYSLAFTDPRTSAFAATQGFLGNHCATGYPLDLFLGTPREMSAAPTAPWPGINYSAAVQPELTQFLDQLVPSQAVADFICRKLVLHFVSDAAGQAHPNGAESLIAAMRGAWGTNGDLKAVMRTLLRSPEFKGNAHRWERVMTPFEFAASRKRTLGMQLSYTPGGSVFRLLYPRDRMDRMGQEPHEFPSPDGFTFHSPEMTSSVNSVEGCIAASDLYRGIHEFTIGVPLPFHPFLNLSTYLNGNVTPPVDPNNATQVAQYESDIADFVLGQLYPGRWTSDDHDAVVDALECAVRGSSILAPPGQSTPTNPGELPYPFESQLAIALSVAGCLTHAWLK